MKPLKLALRIWITITSVLSFLAGWALLSHAPKPASIFSSQSSTTTSSSAADPISVNPLPTLAPIPSLDSIITNPNTAVNLQPLPSFNNNVTTTNNFVPRLRTRGS
jgi:hypothetical protein